MAACDVFYVVGGVYIFVTKNDMKITPHDKNSGVM